MYATFNLIEINNFLFSEPTVPQIKKEKKEPLVKKPPRKSKLPEPVNKSRPASTVLPETASTPTNTRYDFI